MTLTTADRPTPAGITTSAGGNALAGTATLIRFILRRDRIRLPVWLAALTLTTVSTAASFPDLYPTEVERQARAALFDSPAGIAMSGPGFGLDNYTYGSMLAQEIVGFVAILAGLMSVLLLVRHTRTEEETGRAELVRAGVVGRHAHLAAAVIVVGSANLVLGALHAVLLPSMGLESINWTGSLALGASIAGAGLVFTGIAAVTVQVTEYSRAASGLAGAAIGVAYALRAAGDIGDNVLSWLSPIGWSQQTRSYVDERWWVLLLPLVATVLLVATGFVLSTRRDVGSGLRQSRPGPAQASPRLTTPLGFALRLHRGALLWWCVGMGLFGLVYGSIISDVEQFVADNQVLQDAMADVGGATLIDSFLAMVVSILATVSTIFGILAIQRMRSEETSGRAEPLLSTALSRARWAGSHLVVALGGGAAVMLAAGLGLAITAGFALDDAAVTGDILGAALAYVPALWISVGLAIAIFGLIPRAIGLAWAVLVYALVLSMLGGLLQFPEWMNNLSPFEHVPALPAEEFTITPIVVLTAITAGLIWIGVAAFQRRDLTTN